MAASPPTTPEGWRAAAAQDLTAMHDLLRDNSPEPLVSRDSQRFRVWLDGGLADARTKLPKVSDGRGYAHLLVGYATGFRDSHIQVGPAAASGISFRAVAWPGFIVGWRHGGYELIFKASDVTYGPPIGARLVSCDGRSTAEIDRGRDLYDGNLELEAGRSRGALRLFLDRGNPLAARPLTCTFRWGGKAHAVPLRWQPLSPGQDAELTAAVGAKPGKLGIQAWGDRGWWITIPSMEAGQDWTGFYDQVKAQLPGLRSAKVLVVDLRGNGGGDSTFGERLARMLWGDDLVNAREPRLGPSVWRVSKVNRDFWARLVEEMGKNPSFAPGDLQEARDILGAMTPRSPRER